MVQGKSLKELCEYMFEYRDGALYFTKNFHSKQRMGAKAGNLNNCGYLKVCINRKDYLVHRLIFLMHYGYMPDVIDHIDRDKLNNRIENLREADKEINSWNRNLQANNTSGVRGVSWNKSAGKWHSYIKVKGKRVHLGLYDDLEDAKEAYERAKLNTRGNEGTSSG